MPQNLLNQFTLPFFKGLYAYNCNMHRSFLLLFFLPLFNHAQTPSKASSNLQASNVYCNELELSWTSGDGSQRMVLARKSNSINSFPVDNTFYFAKDTFGSGSRLGTDIYIVYRGNGNKVRVVNLDKNSTYYFAVIELNGSGTSFQHLNTSYPEISVNTEDISADFTINDQYQCLTGNSFSFTNNSSHSKNITLNYSWNFGDMNTSTTDDPTHVYLNGGVYQVKLTASARGCRHTTSKGDTVVPAAGVKFALRNDIDSIQCIGSNYYFFQNSTLPKSIGTNVDRTNYSWDFGDGASATGYNAFRIYQNPGVYNVKLVTTRFVTNNNSVEGCSDSAFFTLDVRPGPIDSDSVIFSDTALCLYPNNFVFENRTPSAVRNDWFFGDGQSDLGNVVNHTYTNSGNFTVRLEAEDAIGCRDTLERKVEVFEQPDNSFTGLQNSYCQGDDPSVLTPNLSGGTFYGLGVNPIDASFTPSDTGLIEVGYIVVIGNCRDTAKETTRVIPLPIFSLGKDTFFCQGSQIDLKIDVNATTYSWNDGINTQMRSINKGGIYEGTATEQGCSYTDEISIEEIPAPNLNLGGDTTICGGNSFVLDVTTPKATYRWQDGSTNPTFRVELSGTYWVVASNDCGEDSASKNVEVEAFACGVLLPTAFSPNGDNLNELFIPKGNFRPISFKVFNRWGEILYQSDQMPVWDGKNAQGEILPQGVYYYELIFQTPIAGNWVTDSKSGSIHLIR